MPAFGESLVTAGWTVFDTQLGVLGLAWKNDEITRLVLPRATVESMEEMEMGFRSEPPGWVAQVIARLQKHVAGQRQELLDVPLALGGLSPFRCAVYDATRRVPAGQTVTYGALAEEVGSSGAARAIGTAMATNPFPIIVPCHRVLAANGRPGGFSAPGGLETKAKLLEAEGVRLQTEHPKEQTQLPLSVG